MAAQQAEAGTPRWVRRLATVAAVVAVVIALAAWGLGGFAQRNDHLVHAPGDEVDAGNLVFTLDSATAQPQALLDGGHQWRIRVSGTVRNPHDEALAPITGEYANLAVRDRATSQVVTLQTIELGGAWRRSLVPPGNRPMAYLADFTLGGDFAPGTSLECAVFVQEYTDNAILGLALGAKSWNIDSLSRVQMVTLPLTVVPEG